jgi:hypothetical protein
MTTGDRSPASPAIAGFGTAALDDSRGAQADFPGGLQIPHRTRRHSLCTYLSKRSATMRDHEPTSHPEPLPGQPVRRWPSNKRRRRIVAGAAAALLCAVIGLSVGLTRSPSATVANVAPASGSASGLNSGGGASNARSGPAAGGAAGTVSNVSVPSFTITTAGGQQVTVDEASSTTYQNGTSASPAGAITTGETVLVLGTTNGTTITATQVIVQPTGDFGSAASSAAGVVPLQQGAPAATKQVGQIPATYTQGSGTVVSGTAADRATEAALTAYPGGVVDRVVQLSDGEYEVHDIGVNWPHHIFVNQDFTVVGAN